MKFEPLTRQRIVNGSACTFLFAACFKALVLCLFAISSALASNATIVNLNESSYSVKLGQYVEILEDASGKLTYEDIITPEVSKRFEALGVETPNLGFTTSTVWARISLQSELDRSSQWFLEIDYPPLDEITFYLSDGESVVERVSGDAYAFKQRDIQYHNVVFSIEAPARSRYEVYLKVRTSGSVQLPLTLWQPKAFTEKVNIENYLFGIYCGIMFVVIFYNLFLFASVRDYSYLHYVLYVLFFTSVQMVLFGFAHEYLWPNSPWLANHGLVISLAGTILFIALFSASFLHMKTYSPRSYKLFMVLSWISFGMIIVSMFAPYRISILMNAVLALIVTPLPIVTGFICLRAGYRPARIYLIAWVLLLFGSLAFILKSFALVPANVITIYGPQIGSAIEVILLSLALGDRINYERREKYQAKIEAMENLEKSDRLKDEFMATVSHELRTPLNGVSCSLALIEDGYRKGQDISESLKEAETSTYVMQSIIEDLLTFTEARNAALVVNEETFSLRKVLAPMVQYFDEKCQHKGIVFQYEIDQQVDSALIGDPKKLLKLLSHLIDNAVKFTEQGKVLFEVSVESSKSDSMALSFVVQDTGEGIPEEKQKMVFDAFRQVDNSFTRNYGGLGIGLAICLAFIKALGGDINLESEHGKTRFKVDMTFKRAEESSKESLTKKSESEPLNVLIVEDNPVNQKLICKMVSKMGNQVVAAENGLRGLEEFKKQNFDIVLMDCQMPVMDGYQATQEIRKINLDIPIVAVTANALEKDRRHCFEVGMSDFIAKPINIKELKKVIAHWCR